jgi:alkylation response protein AidB-like acyl-CoA dehydrogenase
MDFACTDIQDSFRATLRRFIAERRAVDSRQDLAETARLWNTIYWSELAALGALAAGLPEAYDGAGGDCIDAMIIAEELGRGLAAAPFTETIVVAAGLIAGLGSDGQKRRWLPTIAAGRLKIAFAEGTRQSGDGVSAFEAAPTGAAGAFSISGRQELVTLTPDCGRLILRARVPDAPGHALFCVGLDEPGLDIRSYPTIDDRRAATVTAASLRVGFENCLGPIGGADEAVAGVMDLAVVAQCAEAVGIMASLINQTIAHLRLRTQFGQALAGFQALQHRLVNMGLAYELALSLTRKAAILCRDESPERKAAVSAAKVQVVEAGRLIGHEAIQMHGAIGMTLELPIGRAVKRLKAMEPQFGSADHHLRRYRTLGRGRAA